jgi:hypothetical protein
MKYNLSNQEHFILQRDGSTLFNLDEMTPGGGDSLFESGEGTGSIQQKDSSCQAKGDYSIATGYGVIALGVNSGAEGTGRIVDSSFTITGTANATTYTASSAHGLAYGSVVEYNGIYAKITSVSSNTKFTTNVTLDASNDLNATTIHVCYGIAYGDSTHVEGNDGIAVGTNSHIEGLATMTYGEYAHAEGRGSSASSFYSHAEGYKTLARNQSEHAQGQFNKSNKENGTFGNISNTIHSIGIGTSENTRKNAVEVMQSGDVYIKGINNYDGTNPVLANSIQVKVTAIDASISALSNILDASTADNGKVLMVVNGQFTLVNPVVLYSGSEAPSDMYGNNGDLYMQTS